MGRRHPGPGGDPGHPGPGPLGGPQRARPEKGLRHLQVLNQGGRLGEEKKVLEKLEGKVLRITLNRPFIRNALDSDLMVQTLEILRAHRDDPEVRVVLFTGAGTAFCAGADLNWMRKALTLSYEETVRDSALLADLFYTIYEYPKPTIALVNGPAIGGGVGFVATCDVVITSEEAFFRLSEVRLGLIPAVISYFLVRKVGESRCRELMLTGRKLSAEESLEIGLSHRVVPHGALEQEAGGYIRRFLSAGPQALRWCKEVIERVGTHPPEEIRDYTVDIIAKLRTGPEGQEGMSAFLEKRPPSWSPEAEGKPD
ncbi:MAG TPA: enoyl-CoA hydratase/isomerase family protein [Planctomycetes bacterium]|nr:enoyl-CoA hydratase/isomerase family protein [Planctomycetota bacterium]